MAALIQRTSTTTTEREVGAIADGVATRGIEVVNVSALFLDQPIAVSCAFTQREDAVEVAVDQDATLAGRTFVGSVHGTGEAFTGVQASGLNGACCGGHGFRSLGA